MTICVPKRPFEIGLIVLYFCFMFSWIPILGVLGYYANKLDNYQIMLLAIPLCMSQITFMTIWVCNKNSEKHWIKWCDTKSENGS